MVGQEQVFQTLVSTCMATWSQNVGNIKNKTGKVLVLSQAGSRCFGLFSWHFYHREKSGTSRGRTSESLKPRGISVRDKHLRRFQGLSIPERVNSVPKSAFTPSRNTTILQAQGPPWASGAGNHTKPNPWAVTPHVKPPSVGMRRGPEVGHVTGPAPRPRLTRQLSPPGPQFAVLPAGRRSDA